MQGERRGCLAGHLSAAELPEALRGLRLTSAFRSVEARRGECAIGCLSRKTRRERRPPHVRRP